MTALFRVMDVNNDGHLDLAEVLEAVAVWCGSDSQEVHKCEYYSCGKHTNKTLMLIPCHCVKWKSVKTQFK